MTYFKCYLELLSPHQNKTNKKKRQSWTPFGKNFWIRACLSACWKHLVMWQSISTYFHSSSSKEFFLDKNYHGQTSTCQSYG